jgi:hypothetical protein
VSAPLVPKTWRGGESNDAWTVDIEHDLMAAEEPFVVTIEVKNFAEGERTSYSLACASPQQAREMANALHVYAYFAEKAERDRERPA